MRLGGYIYSIIYTCAYIYIDIIRCVYIMQVMDGRGSKLAVSTHWLSTAVWSASVLEKIEEFSNLTVILYIF